MAFILMAWGANAQEGGKIVKVDSVRIEPLSQTVPVVGRLVARQSGVVASRSSGPVAALTVQVADRVEKGQELAVLVSDSLRWQNALAVADVSAAQAALKEARAQLAILNQEMERLERLRKSAAFSQARYEDKRQGVLKAQGQLAQAQASLSRAEANRELTKIKLADASITAPYAGVVTQTHTQAGAFLDTGMPVVTLVDDQNLEIEADVPSLRTAGLLPGAMVEAVIDGNISLAAKVRALVPEENSLTRTRPVRFQFERNGTKQNLATNQSVILKIPAGQMRDVISVHKDAVINRKGKNLVYVVIDGKAMLRPITSGQSVGGRFEVIGGLKPGEKVVVRGNERLRPGEAVQVDQ